jgi:CheY-like chemotaxis protein/DNA-directed RNA polymerase subunit RPC12/RpoP
VRSLSTSLGINEGEYQSTTPAKNKQASINPEEDFFLQQLKDQGIRDIQPRFTPQGIEFEALAFMQTYYEPTEILKLLESLTDKGVLEKINYGTVGLCPGCSSPVFMLTLACPRCGSLKVSKKELVKHVECGHSGYSDEFVVGIHYVCPNCGAQAKISEDSEEGGEQFKVSDSLYECEDCRSISAKALTSFNCIKCKTRFSSKDIRYENPCGYRLVEPHVVSPERTQEQPQSQVEEEPLDEPVQQIAFEEPEQVEVLEAELSGAEETEQFDVIEEPEEPETFSSLPPELEEIISVVEQETPVDIDEPTEEELAEEPTEEESEKPKGAEKRGFLDRILSRKEEQQPANSVRPIKVEKEVVKRSDATILLIEQDQYRADRIIKSLERTRLQSIEVKHAPSGRLGLRELRQPYDAVILDMSLSDMDPDQIVREISRWRVTTPLIVITDDEASAKILSRVDLVEVKLLEYSEAAVRQLPGIIERIVN